MAHPELKIEAVQKEDGAKRGDIAEFRLTLLGELRVCGLGCCCARSGRDDGWTEERDSKEACGETCDSTCCGKFRKWPEQSRNSHCRETASFVEPKQQNVVYLLSQSQILCKICFLEFKPCSEDYVGGLSTQMRVRLTSQRSVVIDLPSQFHLPVPSDRRASEDKHALLTDCEFRTGCGKRRF